MFRKKSTDQPAHLRDDYRLERPQGQPRSQAYDKPRTYDIAPRSSAHQRGMTTLQALEVIRLRFEAAQKEALRQQAA
jgi:hypothetical protein